MEYQVDVNRFHIIYILKNFCVENKVDALRNFTDKKHTKKIWFTRRVYFVKGTRKHLLEEDVCR